MTHSAIAKKIDGTFQACEERAAGNGPNRKVVPPAQPPTKRGNARNERWSAELLDALTGTSAGWRARSQAIAEPEPPARQRSGAGDRVGSMRVRGMGRKILEHGKAGRGQGSAVGSPVTHKARKLEASISRFEARASREVKPHLRGSKPRSAARQKSEPDAEKPMALGFNKQTLLKLGKPRNSDWIW